MLRKYPLITGLVTGLLAPLAGIAVFVGIHPRLKLYDALQYVLEMQLGGQVLSLGVIVNLGVFFLFMQYDRFAQARGVILSTFVYVLIVLFVKFI